jgi:hypothetical protein
MGSPEHYGFDLYDLRIEVFMAFGCTETIHNWRSVGGCSPGSAFKCHPLRVLGRGQSTATKSRRIDQGQARQALDGNSGLPCQEWIDFGDDIVGAASAALSRDLRQKSTICRRMYASSNYQRFLTIFLQL